MSKSTLRTKTDARFTSPQVVG